MTETQTLEAPPETGRRRPIKHIRRPDNPDVAWCGYVKPPNGKRHRFHGTPLAEICSMCLSYPGALAYAEKCL